MITQKANPVYRVRLLRFYAMDIFVESACDNLEISG